MITLFRMSLNKAAYYMLYGARLKNFEDDWFFTLEAPDDIYTSIKQQPLVNCVRYMQVRNKLKYKLNRSKGIVLGVNKQNIKKNHIRKRFAL